MTRTYEEIEKIINDFGYELLDEYIPEKGKHRRIVIQDKIGYKYDVELNSILSGRIPNFIDIHNPYSLENIVLWLKLNRPEFELQYNTYYVGSGKKLKFYHLVCEEYFSTTWDSIYQGKGCPICSGHQVGTRTSLAYKRPDLAKEWHQDNKLIPEEIVCGSDERVYWICSICCYGQNKEWLTSPNNRINDTGCPSCYGNITKTPEEFSKELYELVGDEYSVLEEYINNKTKIEITHNVCGYNWSTTPTNFLRGRRCPRCTFSKGEDRIERFLSINNIPHEFQIRFENCKDKNTLPFDFGIPYDDGSWKCIEHQGEQHFFPVDFAGRGEEWAKQEFKELKRRDKIKAKYCKDNNIPLLIIPYLDFDRIEEILSDTLL